MQITDRGLRSSLPQLSLVPAA